MDNAQYSPSIEGNGLVPVETVMQQYTYPGQWFDDLGALVAGATPGMAWDLGTADISRSDINDLLTAYQDMGIDPYPGG